MNRSADGEIPAGANDQGKMDMFEAMKFDEMNEADVREEIIAPLLRELGYRSGTENNIIREQLLRNHPNDPGRKDSRKDPPLRVKADYILEAGGKVRWVILAKSPGIDFGAEEIEQAWTCANHPEVRAVYFVLCNGARIDAFQSNLAPDAGPVLQVDYDALCQFEGYQKLEGLLGPAAVLRDHPDPKIETGPTLARGLRSVARITHGLIRYESNSANHPALNQIELGISGGALQRDEQGRLVAYLCTTSPTPSLQELNERLGLASFEMVSEDGALSSASDRPTLFVYDHATTLPAGDELLDLSTWRRIKLPVNIHTRIFATASGVLTGRDFAGQFTTDLDFGNEMKLRMTGSFTVHLA